MPSYASQPAQSGSGADSPDVMADFAAVYQDNVDFVWRVVARMGVPNASVPDVVQEVFLVVHRRLPDYDARASIRAWLAGICRGVVRNHQRSFVRRQRRLQLLPAPPNTDPDVDRVELGKVVCRCLDELDEDQRLALVLTDIEGVSAAEVAKMLGVSRNTIYSRIRLARGKLRRKLAALGLGFESAAARGGDERPGS